MKQVSAFVTVEYALLLPVIVVVYRFLIFISIYYFYAIEGEHMPYANKYIWLDEWGIERPTVVGKKHSPENILRICKRLQDES